MDLHEWRERYPVVQQLGVLKGCPYEQQARNEDTFYLMLFDELKQSTPDLSMTVASWKKVKRQLLPILHFESRKQELSVHVGHDFYIYALSLTAYGPQAFPDVDRKNWKLVEDVASGAVSDLFDGFQEGERSSALGLPPVPFWGKLWDRDYRASFMLSAYSGAVSVTGAARASFTLLMHELFGQKEN